MKYQTFLGINRPDGWEGKGLVYAGISKDDGQWNWWRRYFEYMTGEPLG
jgi:hypothetical protein